LIFFLVHRKRSYFALLRGTANSIGKNTDLEKLFSEQQKAKSEVYKCRRDYVWEDFTAHRKKPWSDCSNNLVVTFLNESAVDTGGPRREFFSGDQSLS